MPKTNTLVKICGLTSEEQALQVAKLGAHAIGIIAVEDSPRYISAEKKKKINWEEREKELIQEALAREDSESKDEEGENENQLF